MIKKFYSCLPAVIATINQMLELADLSIPKRTWEKAYNVCTVLERAAQVTETQSGSNYMTLSRTSKVLQLLAKKCNKCKTVTQDNEIPSIPIFLHC